MYNDNNVRPKGTSDPAQRSQRGRDRTRRCQIAATERKKVKNATCRASPARTMIRAFLIEDKDVAFVNHETPEDCI